MSSITELQRLIYMLIKQQLIQGLVVLTGLFSLNAQYVSNQPANRSVKPDSLPVRFGFGQPATAEHIARLNDDVRPDGLGLPAGEGIAAQGAVLFVAKCAACHGAGGTGGTAGSLVVKPAVPGKRSEKPSAARVIGNYWPYATTVFDYIQRAMPFNEPGSLTPNEVYALTAYLLAANKLIDEKTVLNAKTLRSVQMPAKSLFVPDDRKGGPEIR